MSVNTQHPSFPSGEWEGFYNYGSAGYKENMRFILEFKNGIVTGSGTDPVGSFRWKGNYDTGTMMCQMAKYYKRHTVFYKGNVDENGIWGNWSIHKNSSGGFHIWPKKTATEAIHSLEEEITIPEIFEFVI